MIHSVILLIMISTIIIIIIIVYTLCPLRRLERVLARSCNPAKGEVWGNGVPTLSAVRKPQASAQSAPAQRDPGRGRYQNLND